MIIKIQFHLFASINFNQACTKHKTHTHTHTSTHTICGPKMPQQRRCHVVSSCTHLLTPPHARGGRGRLYLRVITAECCHTK